MRRTVTSLYCSNIYLSYPSKYWIFYLLHWSELNNWLVWRMHPTLRYGREDKYPHMLLVLDLLKLVLLEPNYSTQSNALKKKSRFPEGQFK